MVFLQGSTLIIAIIFMLTFMFIGIWLFIVALKAYNQLCYKNYILEKIYQKISMDSSSIDTDIVDEVVDDISEILEENQM